MGKFSFKQGMKEGAGRDLSPLTNIGAETKIIYKDDTKILSEKLDPCKLGLSLMILNPRPNPKEDWAI